MRKSRQTASRLAITVPSSQLPAGSAVRNQNRGYRRSECRTTDPIRAFWARAPAAILVSRRGKAPEKASFSHINATTAEKETGQMLLGTAPHSSGPLIITSTDPDGMIALVFDSVPMPPHQTQWAASTRGGANHVTAKHVDLALHMFSDVLRPAWPRQIGVQRECRSQYNRASLTSSVRYPSFSCETKTAEKKALLNVLHRRKKNS